MPNENEFLQVNRRDFVGTALAGATMNLVDIDTPTAGKQALEESYVPLEVTINGQQRQLRVDVRTSLLDLLRNNLQLTGTKKGCDHGQCGACTVLVNGQRTLSCLSLAVMHQGDQVTTVEGLAHGDDLHPVQAAFIENDGFQCGYCTPGQVCSAVALLDEIKRNEPSRVTPDLAKTQHIQLTDDEIRERMSGNLCRCGAYVGIVAAVRAAYEGNANRPEAAGE